MDFIELAILVIPALMGRIVHLLAQEQLFAQLAAIVLLDPQILFLVLPTRIRLPPIQLQSANA